MEFTPQQHMKKSPRRLRNRVGERRKRPRKIIDRQIKRTQRLSYPVYKKMFVFLKWGYSIKDARYSICNGVWYSKSKSIVH